MPKIHPQRIKSILRGEKPVIKFPVSSGKKDISRKEGEIWKDVNDVEWIQKKGYKEKVTKLDGARIPLFCPKCNRVMKGKSTDFYLKTSMCLECVVERDTKMIVAGTFEDFKKKNSLEYEKSFLNSSKTEIENYLKDGVDKVEIVNEDGSIEKWRGGAEKNKKFFEDELKEIDKRLKEIDNEIKEIEEKVQ